MTEVSIRHEFPSSLHVAVKDPKSERSAVQLARNFATRHYGMPVGHYVSSGWSEGAYTYVYSNPSYVVEPEVTPEPVPEPAVTPLKLRSTRYSAPSSPAPKLEGNARQRRVQRRSGGYGDVSRMLAHA